MSVLISELVRRKAQQFLLVPANRLRWDDVTKANVFAMQHVDRMRREANAGSSTRVGPVDSDHVNATAGWIDQPGAGVQVGGGGDALPPVVMHTLTEPFDWRRYFKTQVWVLVIMATVLAPIGCLMVWPGPTLAVCLLIIVAFFIWAFAIANANGHRTVKHGQGRH